MTLLNRTWILAACLSLTGLASIGCEESGDGDSNENADTGTRPGGGGGGGGTDNPDAGGNPSLDVDLGGNDTGTPEPPGYYCADIIECINEAGNPTEQVVNDCKEGASAESQGFIDAALQCIATRCASAATEADFVQCQNTQCGNELRACTNDIGPLPDGDLDCTGVLQCINSSDGSAGAVRVCEAQGTDTAQAQIGAIRQCITANCASATNDDEFLACQQQFCTAELAACTGQSVPSGNATCDETVNCLLTCNNSQTCADTCLAEASQASAQAAIAFYNCGVPTCGSSVQSAAQYIECTTAACPNEAAACF